MRYPAVIPELMPKPLLRWKGMIPNSWHLIIQICDYPETSNPTILLSISMIEFIAAKYTMMLLLLKLIGRCWRVLGDWQTSGLRWWYANLPQHNRLVRMWMQSRIFFRPVWENVSRLVARVCAFQRWSKLWVIGESHDVFKCLSERGMKTRDAM